MSSYCLFPIAADRIDLFRLYKQSLATFWVPEEVQFSAADHRDWLALRDNERHFILRILAFFAGSDGIVAENLASRFQREVTCPVVRLFYAYQCANEGIHSEVYSTLIDTLVRDNDEKKHLFDAIHTIPVIGKKADWCLQWIESDRPFAERLVAFAAVEGIFFSGAFCSIYWLKNRGILPALTLSNEFIARDEGLHTAFAVALYGKGAPLPTSVLHSIISSAVALETEFICEALPCRLIGMNDALMAEYIRFVADRLLVQLGAPRLYEATCPFPFMEAISLEGKTNFFEKKVSEYAKCLAPRTFSTEVEF